MSKTHETGHAKNVANFEALVSFVTSYGAAYNPSLTTIQLAALQAKATAASNSMDQLNAQLAATSSTIASREIAFQPLKKLSTRIANALKATAVTTPLINNMTTLNRKIQGKRAPATTIKKANTPITHPAADPKSSPVQISVAQLSYDSILDTFQKQIALLASIPQYTPNEPELQVATLKTLYNTLKAKNAAVVSANANISNIRLTRNQIIYHPETGLVATAADTKNYVKSLFGASSPQFKQIATLAFKTVPL